MIGKRLILQGSFVEAYLYFDFLWLFANDGSVRAFDVTGYCSERLNGEGAAAAALFSDNRVLEGPQAPVADLADRILKAGGHYDVSAADVDRYSYIFENRLEFRSLLDVRFYYGRAYVGTDASIEQFNAYGLDALSEKRGVASRFNLNKQKIAEKPARALHGRFGAIAAACGKAGGFIGYGADDASPGWRMHLKQFAEASYGVAINGAALTNLVGRDRTQVYQAKLEPKPNTFEVDGEEYGKDRQLRLTSLSETPLATPTQQINQLTTADQTRGVFLFNQSVWRFDVDGKAQRANLSKDPQLSVEISPRKDGPPGRVLSMSTMGAGVIAETDDAVYLQQFGKWIALLAEPVHSVRGYQSSKRYRRVATAVARNRVEVIAI